MKRRCWPQVRGLRIPGAPLGPPLPPSPARPVTQVTSASVMRPVCEMVRTRAASPGFPIPCSPWLEGIPHWVVSSRLLVPGAAWRCHVGLQGVFPGWGPSSHLELDNQKERENHPSLLQGRALALSSPWNQGRLWGTLPGHPAPTASMDA